MKLTGILGKDLEDLGLYLEEYEDYLDLKHGIWVLGRWYPSAASIEKIEKVAWEWARNHDRQDKGYPDNWPEISYSTRAEAGFRCERCRHPDDRYTGYMLTVHHLNKNKSDSRQANRTALCQRCHLHIEPIPLEALVNQLELFEPFELRWLKPHLEGLGIPIPEPRLRNQ